MESLKYLKILQPFSIKIKNSKLFSDFSLRKKSKYEVSIQACHMSFLRVFNSSFSFFEERQLQTAKQAVEEKQSISYSCLYSTTFTLVFLNIFLISKFSDPFLVIDFVFYSRRSLGQTRDAQDRKDSLRVQISARLRH